MSGERPLWVQGDRTVLFEVDHALAEEVQQFLPRFAELEKSPERFHTYRITPLSLWNAAAVGVQADEILSFLESMSRYPPPPNVVHDIRDFLRRYGLLTLARHEGRLVLRSVETDLLEDLYRSKILDDFAAEDVRDGTLPLKEECRGEVKQALLTRKL